MSVHILPLDVHMAIAVDAQSRSHRNALHLSSSQNTSVLAELPCIEVRC